MDIIIKNNLWFKFLHKFYIWGNLRLYNYLKFLLFIKKFIFIILFKFVYQNLLYKTFFLYFVSYKNNNNISLKKKYLQKGYKSKNLGIYIRNFLKDQNNIIEPKNYCYLLMRFKRKNLFLTLLNTDGNVLCKTNIGSCGFKKKVKFTGYAIKRTTKNFYQKIIKSFIKTIYFINKNTEKKKDKIKELILLKKNYKRNKKIIVRKKIKKIKKNYKKNYKIKKKEINLKKNYKIKKIYNKKLIRTTLFRMKVLKNFINYRNYPHLMNLLKNSLKIIFRIKSNLKFWGFRFVMYGIFKRFYWFHGIEIRLPVAHSKGLRLKKKRRI